MNILSFIISLVVTYMFRFLKVPLFHVLWVIQFCKLKLWFKQLVYTASRRLLSRLFKPLISQPYLCVALNVYLCRPIFNLALVVIIYRNFFLLPHSCHEIYVVLFII
jgi:hypothetical protein